MSFDKLHKLAGAFQGAALLLTALELGVFDALAASTKSATEVAEELGLDERATAIALNGLVAMELLAREGDRYSNGQEAATFLVKGAPDYRGAILRHVGNTWEDWAELTETWRRGTAVCQRKEGTIPKDDAGVENFILGMENITRDIAPKLTALLPLEGCKKILDLGAGPGNYVLEFARRCSEATVTHFDLEATSKVAASFIEGKPGSERIKLVSGDFMTDELGEGFDFIWLSQVLHMFGEEGVRKLLSRVSAALDVGGKLGIHEHFLNDDMVSPPTAALFGVHMLAVTPGGRSYSYDEIEELCQGVGLKKVERIDYGGYSRALVVEKTK